MGLMIAIAVVVAGYWAIRKFGRAKPSDFVQWKSKAIGAGVTAFGVLLMYKGNWEAGIGVLALGLGLMGKDRILPEFLRRNQNDSAESTQRNNPPPARGPRMQVAEALQILGLQGNPDEQQIREAHRRLLKDFHPDKGGTNYLAAKINEAKDVLLQR